MMHISDGKLRRFLDGELSQSERQSTLHHLETCSRCQDRGREMSARAELARVTIAGISFSPQDTHSAKAAMEKKLESINKETHFMIKKSIMRIPQAAWIALAVCMVLAAALSFPSVRAAATSFLGIFRVEQVQVIPVDLESLPEKFGSGESFEKFIAEEVVVEEFGDSKEVSNREEAGAAAGIAVRLPEGIEDSLVLSIEQGGRMTFQVNYELARAVLDDIGRQDIALPEGLDGAPIEVVVQPAVTAQFGDCPTEQEIKELEEKDPDEQEADPFKGCTTLMQTTSPTISAPPGLNLEQIGQAYLQILGMSPDEAANFAANVDWTSTFVVPIPRYAEYQQLKVDGVTGTLVESWERGTAWYALMWIKDGVLYVLSGPGDGDTALALANSMH